MGSQEEIEKEIEKGMKGNLRTKREQEEDNTPLWIKIFGGSALSIVFLSVITLTGYIVTNMNSIQSQVNAVNVDMITKKEFYDQQKIMLDTVKNNIDTASISLKEKITAVEQLGKERQLLVDAQNKALELTNKELAAHKERTNNMDSSLIQLREEFKQTQKDIQSIKERIAIIEAKNLIKN